MNIVWFKRDLRWTDHLPLRESLLTGETMGLFIVESEWLKSAEFSSAHLQFVYESLQELKHQLSLKNIPLVIKYGNCIEIFKTLKRQVPLHRVYSHEETGLMWTYRRDLDLKKWFKENSIQWHEYPQFGVIRRLKDRDEWASLRTKIIERPLLTVPHQSISPLVRLADEVDWSQLIQKDQLKPQAQKGGREAGIQYLRSFLNQRGMRYSKSISSPRWAFDGCSRISPYLAWGNISMSEVHYSLEKKRRLLADEPSSIARPWLYSLKQFESRIWWHCHFIQKLESEPEIEFENFNREFDNMRESEFDETKFQAWCKGETGFPLIDACMRALHKHGWINFRMRAMLMSFASYQLWLHWKKPAEFLARHFIDFEPGIHYYQVQMQSGVTGINTIRIYSPYKQQIDQDPDGSFVRTYIPELQNTDLADILKPHETPPLLLLDPQYHQNRNYPDPIVDPEESYKKAKERVFEWKKRVHVRAESQRV